MPVSRLFVATLTLAAGPALAHAQAGGYLARLGADTLSVERFTRSARSIEGTTALHAPAARLLTFKLELNADGSPASYTQAITMPDGSPAPGQPTAMKMTFVGDSVIRDVTMNGQAISRRNAVPKGTIPQLGAAPWLQYELGLREARRTGGVFFTMGLSPQQQAPTKWAVTFVGTDSADVDYFGSPIAFKLDRDGRIVRADGIKSTNKAVVTPLRDADPATIAKAWGAKDAAGQSMGMPSPRDTARGTVASATLTVDYGRPSKRGRAVWGTVVPYGEVWRLGANAATMFTTDKDLEIGGLPVPAGSYTLFFIPAADGGTLIINKQTKQWGTEYHVEQDLVRVHATRTKVPAVAERFTVTVESGELRFHWDDVEYAVPVKGR